MINVSTTYDNIIANGGHYGWQIVNGNVMTVDPTLTSGTLKQTLYETASIGNVLAKELHFTYYKGGTDPDTTIPLTLQFRAVGDSGESDWYNKGKYWIDTIESSPYSNYVAVTAFDPLMKANVTYLKTGTWVQKTDYVILSEIATDIGVTIESATDTLFSGSPVLITEAPSIGTNGTTSIQMLSYIAAMRGGNFFINDDNELQFYKLFAEQEQGADSIDIGDGVENFDASPAETITGVAVYANANTYYRYPSVDDDAWVALGGRKLEPSVYIGGSQALAYNLFTDLGGKIFYPYSAPRAWVDPKWQIGDGITIKDVNSVICNQTTNLTALASCSLVAKGLEIVNSSYPHLTPSDRQIAINEQNIASLQVGVDSITATVSQMTEQGGVIYNLQTQVTQNAEGVQAVTQRVDDQESYMRWDGGTSTLSIGATDAPTEARITPDGFAVVQNGEEILTAEGHVVNAKHIEAETVTVGRYQWIDEDSKGFSLVFTGV